MIKKHLTQLETQAAYEAFVQSEAFEAPNVSLITELGGAWHLEKVLGQRRMIIHVII